MLIVGLFESLWALRKSIETFSNPRLREWFEVVCLKHLNLRCGSFKIRKRARSYNHSVLGEFKAECSSVTKAWNSNSQVLVLLNRCQSCALIVLVFCQLPSFIALQCRLISRLINGGAADCLLPANSLHFLWVYFLTISISLSFFLLPLEWNIMK